MFNLDDALTIENGADSEEEYFTAMQKAINSGHAWSLQGSMGRAMMGAIESGKCLLGRNDAFDYWKNHVPSRFQVQAGTKGSREYVAAHSGEQWAAFIEQIE